MLKKLALALLTLPILVGLSTKPSFAFTLNIKIPSFSFSNLSSYFERMRQTRNKPNSQSISYPTPQTPLPTVTPTPSPSPTYIFTPTPEPASDNVKSYILKEINTFRDSYGLPPVNIDSYTCNFAKTRAQEISNVFNHDGFTQRLASGTLPYPSYSRVTENIAMTPSYKEVVIMWINSPGHAENMRMDTPFVCVEKYGNYYAYEGWKP